MASSQSDLTSFKALSFDCYGTLIDWETGIITALKPLIDQLPASHAFKTDPQAALHRLEELAGSHQSRTPTLPYNEVLAMSMSELAHETGVSLSDSVTEPFGNAVGTWGPFPDTVAGLQKLAQHYKLIILSNVNNSNMESTLTKQLHPAKFDAAYTAQDIGSYKPGHQNFQYLFGHAKKDLNVDWEKGDLLHVAESLKIDHVPSKELGLRSVWISRGYEEGGSKDRGKDIVLQKYRDATAFEWRFTTIGEFADEVERQFAAKKS
ncbi:HAD-like domain-containing protein [Astrocystis sublimbata]|nr:HAD-like domain-containing protein [Astrocystis sublimbata]